MLSIINRSLGRAGRNAIWPATATAYPPLTFELDLHVFFSSTHARCFLNLCSPPDAAASFVEPGGGLLLGPGIAGDQIDEAALEHDGVSRFDGVRNPTRLDLGGLMSSCLLAILGRPIPASTRYISSLRRTTLASNWIWGTLCSCMSSSFWINAGINSGFESSKEGPFSHTFVHQPRELMEDYSNELSNE
ncbi:hypothetical protein MIMGU_mgv1a014449mg [Erythranthe guttata]|uniref:Uncharacterized protein n=1 Tax=Erythranthe guttata TaxID=4155 RepID=A0A022Q3A9_ERYGU|nr:hypothetical protein MIMGU_mgv1a014449mg [Erythranthe guttata]